MTVEIVDISDRFSDLNQEDRVFECEGVKFKVKTWPEFQQMPVPSPGGHSVLKVLRVLKAFASVVGDEGKALRLPNGAPLIAADDHRQMQTDSPVDVAVELALLHASVIGLALTAYRTTLAMTDVPGLGAPLATGLHVPPPSGPALRVAPEA